MRDPDPNPHPDPPGGQVIGLVLVTLALLVPVGIGLGVGLVGGGMCDGGLECLGYPIYGVLIGAVVGLGLAVVAGRRLRLPWLLLLTLLAGWAGIAVLKSLMPWALDRGGASTLVWVGVAIGWPLLLGALWGRGRRRTRWIGVIAVVGALIVLVPATAWLDESSTIDWSRRTMAGSHVAPLGPAADELTCLGPFSDAPTDGSAAAAYAYKLVEPSGHEWYARVPHSGEVTFEKLTGTPDPGFRARLRPVSRDWLATCTAPLHRWALDHGLWGSRGTRG